ncbi:MAG TPA: protocatechuate 3,4-dioxygenase subunit alpha [Stellaceae bacterium]|nr:protocatechuate 3,4-dioxygenase subunit alpha [Stellaceae bacterium]
MAAKLIPTPSQTVGPFFHLALDRPEWSDLTRDGPAGERIAVTGRVLDGDGAPVADACLELWQANAAGRYAHPEDTQQDKPLDPNFRGFGRVSTDADGCFRFVTIRPGAVPGRGNAWQAPHIAVTVFARGLLKQLVTRIYFADEKANATDPVLSAIADPDVRATLIARRTEAADLPTYRFDIVLQGAGETAFFEV